MKKTLRLLFALLILSFILAACGTEPPASTATPTETALVPTWTLVPTNTFEVVMSITSTPDPNISATDCDASTCFPPTWTAFPTTTPYPTATSCPGDTPCPTQVLSDEAVMSTQIIAGATATTEHILTATAESFIEATVMPNPTLSEESLARYRERWRYELEAAAGFSHPVFDTLFDQIMMSAQYAVSNDNYFSSFNLEPQVERVSFEGIPYVAIIVRNRLDYISTELLMFRFVDHQPVYIPHPIDSPSGYIMGFTYGMNWNYREQVGYIGGFADRNGNGYPDIAIDTTTHGSSPFQSLLLLEIQSGGLVVDLTPRSSRTQVRSFVDVNDDGILEYELWGCVGHPFFDACSFDAVNLLRYFGWNGLEYVNISSTLGDEFYPSVNAFWNSIQPNDTCVLPSAEMYKMLVDYIAWEQLAGAWAELEPRLRWDDCSPEVYEEHYDEMFALQDWVSRNLLWTTIYP